MSEKLDLNLLPVARYGGQEYPELLGLFVSEPPKRAARGRGSDRLILYLAMTGNAPLSPSKQEQALAYLADLYYKTPGSVTSGLRAISEEFNNLLHKRNVRIASSGRQGVGLLVQAVLRDEQLTLAHCGPTHTFLITANEVQHFHDPEMAGLGLGQGRSAPLHFFQATIKPNDTLILAAQPAPDWDPSTLGGIHGQGPESLRRRLFGSSVADLNAVLIQAKAGQGKFYLPKPKSEEVSQASIDILPDVTQAPVAVEPVPGIERMEASPIADSEPEPAVHAVSAPVQPEPEPMPREGAAQRVGGIASNAKAGRKSRGGVNLAPLGKFLVIVGTPMARVGAILGSAVKTLFVRMLPGEFFQSIPVPLMALIAIVIPAIVVTAGSWTYIRLGRDAQNEILLAQAQQKVLQAASQTDLLARRAAWEDILEFLQPLGNDPKAEALRVQARNALDDLDLIKRLEYKPALQFDPQDNVQITNLLLVDDDLYMLEGNSGTVLRAQLIGQAFVWDQTFQCGPNISGVRLSGPIIDILAWPAGFKPVASVVALDASGNLLFCSPNKPPETGKLTTPPNGVFGNLMGFTYDEGNLYVLDPLSNAVWIYLGSKVEEEPYLFFDQQIPFMQDVVDLAVNNEELYLLHSDGRMTVCFYSAVETALTRCSDQQYMDFRPGRENTPWMAANPFTQVLHSQPPDPALFLLEPVSKGIYHFSLRSLAFQRQFMPSTTLAGGGATAYAVNPIQRYFFLAAGGQVYYAAVP
ncbi:MAG: hypothetical protein AB1894_07020 [Chloroflexota bacterium]